MSDSGRRAGAGGTAPSSESARRASSSGGVSGLDANTGSSASGSTGIGGIGSSNASSSTAGQENRSGTSPSTGGTSTSRADQERQLRTSREQGGSRASSQAGAGQSAQQQPGRVMGGYYGGTSPFAMMRRMMDDMDRLFTDFGFAQPGFLSSGLFGSDLWPSVDSSRALGSGQSGTGQQRSGQSGSQQGPQRSGENALQPWSQGLWSPQVEVRESGNNLVVRADLPGLSRDDVDVEVDDDALIIRGERRNDWENEDEGYYRSERSYGSFYRAIPLPEGVDPNACKATFKDGVLEVTLPKPEESPSRGRKIPVK
jgi:HSP20 family protein